MADENKMQVKVSDAEKSISDLVQKLVSQDGKLDVVKAVEAIGAMKRVINRLVDAISANVSKLKVQD
jgi:hypothetical protein